MTELWALEAGPLWHVRIAGIPPLHEPDAPGRLRRWRPWPGETVTIAVDRPPGAQGQSLTLDRSHLRLRPGARSTHATLSLDLRASRGGRHPIQLPADAQLEAVSIDGKPAPLRLDGQRLVLPVRPGSQTIEVVFRTASGIKPAFRAPAVDLGASSTNAQVEIDLEDSARWILWLAGPRLGPAVHFWSLALVLALVGWVLARARLAPLSAPAWTFLLLGAATVDVAAALGLGAAFLFLGWRGKAPPPARPVVFNLGQAATVFAALVAAGIILAAIQQGLLARPDMGVHGNASHASRLVFYEDRIGATLPRPLVLSAPLLAYRLAMLAWALWLASATVKWGRWVWGGLRQHGLWRPMRDRAPQPPTPPPPAPTGQAPP